MRKILIFLLIPTPIFAMTFNEYVNSDYAYIKKQAKTSWCYKKMLKRINPRTVIKQKRKVKLFCSSKLKGRYITYEGSKWYAYIFYKGPRKCKKGRYWFFPKVDCSKVSF